MSIVTGAVTGTVTVKVCRFPGLAQEVIMNAGSTVAEALSMAGITLAENEEIRLNGTAVSADSTISTDSTVVVAKKIKGNTEFEVKVCRFPGLAQTLIVEAGTSVKDVLNLAGITLAENEEIRLNGTTVELNAGIVTTPSTIVLAKKIKGNNNDVEVKVCRFPGLAQPVIVEYGTEISDVLSLAGITLAENEEIRLNGATASIDDEVYANSTVVVAKKIKGN